MRFGNILSHVVAIIRNYIDINKLRRIVLAFDRVYQLTDNLFLVSRGNHNRISVSRLDGFIFLRLDNAAVDNIKELISVTNQE